jgi:hypothetical protein
VPVFADLRGTRVQFPAEEIGVTVGLRAAIQLTEIANDHGRDIGKNFGTVRLVEDMQHAVIGGCGDDTSAAGFVGCEGGIPCHLPE